MATYEPVIRELERELLNVTKLSQPVGARQVRVTEHPPGAPPVDVTDQYADGLRRASDALLKAVTVLKTLPNA